MSSSSHPPRDLKRENKTLKKGLKAQRKKFAELCEQFSTKESELRDALEEIQNLTNLNETLATKMKDLEQELKTKQRNFKSNKGSSSSNNDNKSVFNSIVSTISGESAEIKKLSQEMEVVMAELHEKIEENERLHKDIFNLKQAHQRDVLQLESLVQKEMRKTGELRSDIESKRTCITGLSDERMSIQQMLEEKIAQVEQMQKSHAAKVRELTEINVRTMREMNRLRLRFEKHDSKFANSQSLNLTAYDFGVSSRNTRECATRFRDAFRSACEKINTMWTKLKPLLLMSVHLETKRDRDMVDDKNIDEEGEELDPDDEDDVSGSDTTQLVALTTHVLENLPEQIRSTSELRDCVLEWIEIHLLQAEKPESMKHTSEVYEFVRRKRVRCENMSDTLRVKIETFVQSFEKLVVPLQMLLDASRARDEMKTDDVVRVRQTRLAYESLSNEISKFRDELDAAAALTCVLVLRRNSSSNSKSLSSACEAMTSLVSCMKRLLRSTKEVVSIQVVRAFTPPQHQFDAAALMRVFEGVVEDLSSCLRYLGEVRESKNSGNNEVLELRSRTFLECINRGVLSGEITVVVEEEEEEEDLVSTRVVRVRRSSQEQETKMDSVVVDDDDDVVKEDDIVVKDNVQEEEVIKSKINVEALGSYEFIITNSNGERICEMEHLWDQEEGEDAERKKWQARLKRVQDKLRISDGKAVMHFQQLSQLKEKNRKLLSERKRQIEVLAQVKHAMAEREDEFETHRENYERQIRLLSERCAELEARLK